MLNFIGKLSSTAKISTTFDEFSPGFGIQGSTDEEMREAEQQNCFWEYYVQNCPAYLTHNVNLNAGLANGTSVKEHSLAFDSVEEKIYLEDMINTTPIRGTIDFQMPPTAINVELYPDYYGDDQDTLGEKMVQHNVWTHGSITDDGKIIIPINRKTKKYRNDSIRVCGRPFHYNASTVLIADSFLIELGLCITVPR